MFTQQGSRPKTKLGRMDTTQVTLIHKILAAADERNLPLWNRWGLGESMHG
ncbi:Aminoglycoside-2''-adenylyltransferase [Enterobacter hormaechei]|nr:Aminoglycoside-2''-adenylyltransferase [Enterobacter hormaechei]